MLEEIVLLKKKKILFSSVPYLFWAQQRVISLDSTSTAFFFNQTGYQISKSDVIFQLEQGKELWPEAAGGLQGQSPGEHP